MQRSSRARRPTRIFGRWFRTSPTMASQELAESLGELRRQMQLKKARQRSCSLSLEVQQLGCHELLLMMLGRQIHFWKACI